MRTHHPPPLPQGPLPPLKHNTLTSVGLRRQFAAAGAGALQALAFALASFFPSLTKPSPSPSCRAQYTELFIVLQATCSSKQQEQEPCRPSRSRQPAQSWLGKSPKRGRSIGWWRCSHTGPCPCDARPQEPSVTWPSHVPPIRWVKRGLQWVYAMLCQSF